jgi:hypothetical protein
MKRIQKRGKYRGPKGISSNVLITTVGAMYSNGSLEKATIVQRGQMEREQILIKKIYSFYLLSGSKKKISAASENHIYDEQVS